MDAYLPLNRKKHPFFEHSEADFFLAVQDGKVIGRICAANNKRFNDYHKTKKAQFYFFDAINDLEVARALFDAVTTWANERGLDTLIGPKGLSPFDGYGILVEGFEHRQMMTMMNYNFDYYPGLMEALGFEKEVDFVEGDVKYAVDNVFLVADHRLIKVILHQEEIVGFLFAFPDVSAALQRAQGRLFPFGIIDLLLEMKRTRTISGNGMGILPEFQGKGGNALLYYEMGRTVLGFNQFEHVEMTQVAETTRQMRADLKNLNGVEYKNHRVYRKAIA
jgi:hypothetical protein